MTVGTVVEFTPAKDVAVEMRSSRPSKDECLVIGFNYYTAVAEGNEKEIAAMLKEHGGILLKRSLKVFGNYAARTKQGAVAKFADSLRSEIKVERAAS